MKRILFIIGLVGLSAFANAQNNINQYEYWFDSDFTNRVTTNVTPTQLFTLNTAVSAISLENGLHTFHIRFRDEDSNFSSVVSQIFQKVNQNTPGTNAIAGFEYWFDDDYASKVSQAVTPQALYQLNSAISANQLAVGLHTFHVRFIDTGGNWSPTVSQFFQKVNPNMPGANAIAGFEYWFDGDYANKVSQMVTPQALYQLNTAISANQLAVGLHTFHVRFVDTGGNWSPTVSQFFQKINPNAPGTNTIAGFEYWFDNDYANKVSQAVTPQTLYQLNTAVSASQLAVGLHTFHVRFIDTGGNWSPTVSQFFQKVNQNPSSTNAIVGFEYWFDGDYANKVSQAVTPQALYQLNSAISANQLAVGLHTFHVRFVDTGGNWSPTVSQFFQKINPNPPGTNAIAGFEYWFDDDYANKVSQVVTPQTLYQLNTALDANMLENGLHKLHIRFQDLGGSWSSTVSQFFQKVGEGTGIPNVISAYRYWFDGDMNTMVNQTLNTPSNPLYLTTNSFNVSQVDTGQHQIHFQFRDMFGQWSMVVTDTFVQLGQPRLDFVTPNKGGNTGDVTARITGVFFSPLKVRLEKQGQLPIEVPDSLVSIFNGQEIKATFDLRNKTIGEWNVVVEIVGDTTMILENGFSIDSGNIAQPWTNIIGFDVIRPNQWQNYSFIVGNNGNIDATGVPLWMVVPQNVEVQTIFPVYQPNDSLGIIFDTIPKFYLTDTLLLEVGNFKVIPLFVPKIAPSQNLTLNLKLRSPVSQQFDIQTWASKPLYQNLLNQEAVNCYAGIANEVFTTVLPYPYSCLYSVIDFGWRPILNQIFYKEEVYPAESGLRKVSII